MKELEGDQALVVVQRNYRVELALPRAEEYRVRRVRPVESQTARSPRLDRGSEQTELFVAERPPFPCVGVETGERQPRTANTEVAPQRFVGDLRRTEHIVAGDPLRHVAKANVGGDEHDPQRRSGHHHANFGAGGQTRDRLGMAREIDAERLDRLLAHRRGDDRARLASPHELDGTQDGAVRRLGARWRRMTGAPLAGGER